MVSPSKKTAAYRLFHHRYQVRIPQTLLYSKIYLDKVGYNISGDARVDHAAPKQLMAVNQTAAGLAILHSQGAPLDFIRPDRIPVMYNDIQEHLNDWLRIAHQGVHPASVPPMEDFRKFEAVAMELHRIAKLKQPIEEDPDLFRRQIMSMQRSRNPTAATTVARKRFFDDQGNIKPYVSIVDRIEDLVMEY